MRAGRAFAVELAEALADGTVPRVGSVGTAGPGGRAAGAGVGAEAGATGADQRTADAGRCAGPVARVRVELYGSLGATGRGHATDRAVVMGLAGYEPETVPAGICRDHMESVETAGVLEVHGVGPVPFSPAADIRFLPGRVLPYHVNGMTLTAHRAGGGEALRRTFYSVGGGFVMEDAGEPGAPSIRALAAPDAARARAAPAPHPFSSSAELLEICRREGLAVSDVVMANEASARPREEVIAHLDRLRGAMSACIEAGMAADGVLPGGLGVRQRARALHERLLARSTGPAAALTTADPLRGMDWVNLFALAVSEENAAGRRVVTAPTNGAAGIVPAVLAYYERFIPGGRRRRCASLPAGRHRRRRPHQDQRLHRRGRGGLPGGGGIGVVDGGGRIGRGPGRDARAGGERRGDRHGAQPGAHLRPCGRARADPLHRAQRGGGRQGDQRRPHGAMGGGTPRRQPRHGHRDHASDRRGHALQVQGDVPGRAGRQRRGVLSAGRGVRAAVFLSGRCPARGMMTAGPHLSTVRREGLAVEIGGGRAS